MDTTTCPDCRAPAEITDRFVLESTDGPIEHVRLRCLGGHWFLMPTRSLAASRGTPTPAVSRGTPAPPVSRRGAPRPPLPVRRSR
jgi:hypothetical protein